MLKCNRCNRAELPTKEFKTSDGRQQRLCPSCEAKVRDAHDENFLTFIKGSTDDGIVTGDLSPQDGGGAPPADVTSPTAAGSNPDPSE